MKNLIFLSSILFAAGCSSSVKETPNMPGAYLMTSQTLNNGKTDTKYTSLKQLKIYTDSLFMYVQVNPSDSVSSFGVGSFIPGQGTVSENRIYSSSDTNFYSTPSKFELNISKTQDGYEQIIPELETDSVKYKLTEIYQSVGTDKKTPLDGVWRETSSFTFKANDTTMNNRTQYKTYYDGYFMFGHTVVDSASKHQTGIGFGTFEWINDHKIKETDLNSTYPIIAGNTFDVDIEMNGPDKYKQTLKNADGSTGVEYYERLKK
jgi:hypothetical protein